MFTSREPLVEFYQNLLPAARSVGYKLVLTALAREADSPSFYEDVKRYWSSLHDATGPDVLFVFAGANAAKELNNPGLRDKREPIAFQSDHVAFEGTDEKNWKMYWHGRFCRPELPWSNDLPAFRRGRPRLDNGEDIATDHTLEIHDLSRFLGVPESQLPCLVFTLLAPGDGWTTRRITVPFSRLERTTIYLYLKWIAEQLQDSFRSIDETRQAIARAQGDHARDEKPLRTIGSLRRSVRYAATSLPSAEARDAVAQILKFAGVAGRSSEDRSKCFSLFQLVRGDHQDQDGIVSDLQRLIDLSFLPRARNVTFNEQDLSSPAGEPSQRVLDLQRQEQQVWSVVQDTLANTITSEGVAANDTWDFFIAYSSPNRSIAERAYCELSSIGRPFLDCRCLRPGDLWTERIRAAQTNSRSTILLITKDTPQSWFAESEYLYAIQLMRAGKHVLIPVLYGEGASLPYGLEQVHNATLAGWQDIGRLPGLVGHVVSETKGSPIEGQARE